MGGDIPQVIGSGLLAGTVAAQLADQDPQLLRQLRHRGGRGGGHVVRDDPSHGSVHNCTATPITFSRTPDEQLISGREGEVPDQLSAGRLGKPAQLRQLILSENTSLVATGAPSPEDQTPTENT